MSIFHKLSLTKLFSINWTIGSRRDDYLSSSRRDDVILGNKGDDTLAYSLSRNKGDHDAFVGGRGEDTLKLELTSSEWANSEIREDTLRVQSKVENAPQRVHHFESFDLKLWKVERVKIYVDGEEYVPKQIVDLSGSTQDETIELLDGGDKVVTTGRGNDVVILGAGDDIIATGAGDDYIVLGDGNDIVRAGAGNDTIVAGTGGGQDTIDGGPGIDTVDYVSISDPLFIDLNEVYRSQVVADDMVGSTVGDLLEEAGYDPDTPVGIATGDGIETDIYIGVENIFAGHADDTVLGNSLDNEIRGRGGNDTISGGAGNDLLIGGDGNDSLSGDEGDDEFRPGLGADTIDGGEGQDTLVLSGDYADYELTWLANDALQVANLVTGEAADELRNIERISFDDRVVFSFQFPLGATFTGDENDNTLIGNSQPNEIFGLEGNDQIYGRGGNDYLYGGAGDDLLDGEEGYDTASYTRDHLAGAASGITADLTIGQVIDGFGDTDQLVGITDIEGSPFDDVIQGSSADEGFVPYGGFDEIHGGAGFDAIYNNFPDYDAGVQVVYDLTEAGRGQTVSGPGGAIIDFTGIEYQTGTSQNDVILGGAGEQIFRGNMGADLLDGGAGEDTLEPTGPGNITVNMLDLASASEVADFIDLDDLAPEVQDRLSDGPGLDGFYYYTDGAGELNLARNFETINLDYGGNDTFVGDDTGLTVYAGVGDDNLTGGDGEDEFFGDIGNDVINGGGGGDSLYGESGDDVITGGAGDDYVVLGFGADEFGFSSGDGFDVISDFEFKVDHLGLVDVEISAVVEEDANGDGTVDTQVQLSSGEAITLLGLSGVMDVNELLS